MILTYHEISAADCAYEYSVTQEAFRAHLSFCATLMREHGTTVAVSFDDGHASHRRHAVPLMKQENCRDAVFFITAGWTGSRLEYMRPTELREVAAAGYSVQSHGWSHRFLTSCSDAELRRELGDSKAKIEDCTGLPVDEISMPGGQWDNRVVEACGAAGYRRVYISDPWFGEQRRGDVIVCGRLMVRRKMTPDTLAALARAEQNPLSWRRLPYLLRRTARTVAGPAAYHKLWTHFARTSARDRIDREYRESSLNG